MAHDTTARRMKFYGRSLLDASEKPGVPWYAGKRWLARKEAIQARVARQQGIAHERALIRKAKQV